MNKHNIHKQNVGNAGEYYFASRLSGLDFTVTITLGRTERYDILAVSPKGKTYKFSVKTRFISENTSFTLSEKDENKHEPDLFYVFVRLHGFEKPPEFWIIPSKKVSEIITEAHKKWKVSLGKHGQEHNNNTIRNLPVILKGSLVKYYPKSWEIELKNYYQNFDILN